MIAYRKDFEQERRNHGDKKKKMTIESVGSKNIRAKIMDRGAAAKKGETSHEKGAVEYSKGRS